MASETGGLFVAQTARWVLHAAKSNEVTVPSLQGIMLPEGFTVTEVESTVLGQAIDRRFGSGAIYDAINFDMYWTKGDPTRVELATAAVNATPITDSRFYVDECDFSALDLITDPSGSYRIGSITPPSGAKSELITRNITVLPAGMSAYFECHIQGSTLATTANGGAGTPATITDSGSGFVTAGFEAGMTVILDNIDGNNPLYAKIETVVAGTITLSEGVGDEGSIPAFTFTASAGRVHGANPIILTDPAAATCT